MLAKEYSIEQTEYVSDPEHKVASLKCLNIFIGANNSGKSRLMREMFQATVNNYSFYPPHNKQLEEIYQTLHIKYQDNFMMGELRILASTDTGDYASTYNAFMSKLNKSATQRSNGTNIGGRTVWDNEIATAILNAIRAEEMPGQIKVSAIDAKHIYIPIIRGVRRLAEEDFYKSRTVTDYEFNLEDGHSIFTGQTVYEEIKRMLLGNKKDRKLITDFEEFLSINFFENKGITLVADYESDCVKIDIGDGEEFRPLHDVGDGIQSIIMCCFPAFKNREVNTRLYIEEPELTMHPSVQRVLIEVLINRFPKLQTFITTHSNHFLDLVYDYENKVSIYTFEKKISAKKEQFLISNATNYSRIIDLIGLRNSSVFLANCVIWTEGVTDRMLLRRLLKMKLDFEYKEDYHYTFSEYGGLNIENYDFVNENNSDGSKAVVKAISKRNLVIVDNDLNEPGGSKDERIQKLKKALEKNAVYDKYVEIENLLPFSVWVDVIKKITEESEAIGYKLQGDLENNEQKFNEGLLENKIGVLLKKYIIEYKSAKPPKYSESDSISCLMRDKKTIMNLVLQVMEENALTLEDLGKGATQVVSAMDKFVGSNNTTN